MKNRKIVFFLGLLLLTALLCGLVPAASAQEPGESPVLAVESDMARLIAHEGDLKDLREDALTCYLSFLYAAEETDDPVEQERLLSDADSLWTFYCDLLSIQTRLGRMTAPEPEQSSAPAEAEQSPLPAEPERPERPGERWHDRPYPGFDPAVTDPYLSDGSAASDEAFSPWFQGQMGMPGCPYGFCFGDNAEREGCAGGSRDWAVYGDRPFSHGNRDWGGYDIPAPWGYDPRGGFGDAYDAWIDEYADYWCDEDEYWTGDYGDWPGDDDTWFFYHDDTFASPETDAAPVTEESAEPAPSDPSPVVGAVGAVQSAAAPADEPAAPVEDAAMPAEETTEPVKDAAALLEEAFLNGLYNNADLDDWEEIESFFSQLYDEIFNTQAPEETSVEIPNPWTETDSLDTAIWVSGIKLAPLAAEALPQGMELLRYRAMENTIEADFSDGEDKLMLRASLEKEGLALAGDYHLYSTEWTEKVGDTEIDCLGDGVTVNVAAFKAGDVAVALDMAGGKEGAGLSAAQLEALVKGLDVRRVDEADVQETPEDGKPDVYADAKAPEESQPAEKNGEIMILYTSDVHCGADEGFGYADLKELRESLEAQGYTTILVDDGDAIQGEALGTLSKGEAIIDIMNALEYDVAIPGNHEFDYGTEQFLKLTEKANFPYISCNFNKEGELVFKPYIILEAAGRKIAFVGVTTPTTLFTSTPSNFQDEQGNYIYGFMQDKTGESLWKAVQSAVDSARAEGAEYVYIMGHLGDLENCRPWTYEDIITHTNGIDVFFDGHKHDSEQTVVKNKDGKDVPRSACGTKLNCIGYSHIDADGRIVETNIWSWPNKECAAELFNVHNEVADLIKSCQEEQADVLNEVVAHTDVELTTEDPMEKDSAGNFFRMVRRAETNLGDLCADAFRLQSGADVGIINGGAIRTDIEKGDVTYGDIINVQPFGDSLSVIEVSGQQILDALEWGSRSIPDEVGAFLQVSGLSYEIHSYIDSGCQTDENGMMSGIEGERRVKNVLVGGEAIDPQKTYSLAGIDYLLFKNGDGYTCFEGAKVLKDRVKLDNQILIDYITDDLHGVIGGEYADPYGQGRIVIVESAPAASADAETKAEPAAAEPEADSEPTPAPAEEPAEETGGAAGEEKKSGDEDAKPPRNEKRDRERIITYGGLFYAA